MPEKLLTKDMLDKLEDEALNMLATAPKRCTTRLERFALACSELSGAMGVIESKDALAKLKAKKPDAQQTLPLGEKKPAEQQADEGNDEIPI